MSVISATTLRTTTTSILKHYTSNRDKIKENVNNRVRFELLKERNLKKLLLDAADNPNMKDYRDYILMVKDTHISEADFRSAIQESRECINMLKPKFVDLAEALISLNWTRQTAAIILEYQTFLMDLLSAHNIYTQFALHKLVSLLVPHEKEEFLWKAGIPTEAVKVVLDHVHDTIGAVLEIIPLSQNLLIEAVYRYYPYITKPPYVVSGFVYNIFCLLSYRPSLKEELFPILLKKLIFLDVNTPRNEIEAAECEYDDEDMFEMEMEMKADACGAIDNEDTMKSQNAEALDCCLDQLFIYIENEYGKDHRNIATSTTFKLLMHNFESSILPTHNSHHVQFILFYYSSLDKRIAESFLSFCWQKVRDLNAASIVRQTAMAYVASILARAMFLQIATVKEYLHEMCLWIHQYIQRCDSANVYTLRAHTVFYATCQALFYVISFRSRELTSTDNNLVFLQSLQLSTIVTSHLNPLRVCLPMVATAFSGVTRAHQLAYCHTILEKNARRKLATIYKNDSAKPEECLDTFFPFDQYLLKKSGKRITPFYREYQASDAEEGRHHQQEQNEVITTSTQNKRRKHLDSVVSGDDMDDFIMVDKRLKVAELSKSFDRELQFNNLTPKY